MVASILQIGISRNTNVISVLIGFPKSSHSYCTGAYLRSCTCCQALVLQAAVLAEYSLRRVSRFVQISHISYGTAHF